MFVPALSVLLIYAALAEMLYECSDLSVPIFPFLKKSGAERSVSRIMIPIPFLKEGWIVPKW